jgi:hypothetical protein
MITANQCYGVFAESIRDYHVKDDIDAGQNNPYPEGIKALLYEKNWIDTVQWHLEDVIRNPDIDPKEALAIKRRIDASNQDRTDKVEKIDDYFQQEFSAVSPLADARINSETPAWLVDRMSILMLKIYHMNEQAQRADATAAHRAKCAAKLEILMEQKDDMQRAFDELMEDVGLGRRRFKVYRQMKMYNDATLNPVLYARKPH